VIHYIDTSLPYYVYFTTLHKEFQEFIVNKVTKPKKYAIIKMQNEETAVFDPYKAQILEFQQKQLRLRQALLMFN
jgi:hypothetical protein